jgi:hypothetical protein
MDRVIECHLAHRAASGIAAGGAGPLDVDDARVAVSPTATAFRIAITSENPDTAREVIAKSRALIAN